MKKTIVIVSFVIILVISIGHVWALSSPSPTPKASTTDEIINSIHQEVQKRTSSTQVLPKNIGAVGFVSGMSAKGDLVKITTVRQGEKSASISAQTTIFRVDASGSRTQVKASEIKVGDSIIAMGQVDDNGLVTAKRIILYVPDNAKRVVYVGRVLSSSLNKLSIETVIGKKNIDFAITKDSDFNQFVAGSGGDGKLVDLKIANLNDGDIIIVAGTQASNKTAEAGLIVKLSSASPQPTPTVKANLKKTP